MPSLPPFARLIALIALALPQLACVSSRTVWISPDDTLLAERELAGGGEVSWRLQAARSGSPSLDRVERWKRDTAWLGIRVRDLDRRRAEDFNADAGDGVYVVSVTTGEAAHAAGIESGDVLVHLGGPVIGSSDELELQLEDLTPDEPVRGALLRRDDRDGAVDEIRFEIVPKRRSVPESKRDSFDLESSRIVSELTGLQAAELPFDLSSEVLEVDGPTVLVAAVSPGSPAYKAGLRAGDRLTRLDGQVVTGLDDLRRAVAGRAAERKIALATEEDLRGLGERTAEGPLQVEVDGRLGVHSTEFDVRENLGARSSVDIPILFERDSDASFTRWSFLEFIFQFGANYRGQYLDSDTRETARSTYFSMLPFGFFEVEKRPGWSRYCILWFIEWERRS
ncbi:MAG: PDZ domain-containing protein [Planctomycetota bacterium]